MNPPNSFNEMLERHKAEEKLSEKEKEARVNGNFPSIHDPDEQFEKLKQSYREEQRLSEVEREARVYGKLHGDQLNILPGVRAREGRVIATLPPLRSQLTPMLSKREHFAGVAMQGLLSDFECAKLYARIMTGEEKPKQIAEVAVKYADALIKELEK